MVAFRYIYDCNFQERIWISSFHRYPIKHIFLSYGSGKLQPAQSEVVWDFVASMAMTKFIDDLIHKGVTHWIWFLWQGNNKVIWSWGM